MRNEFKVNGEVTTIFIKRKNGTIIETIIDTCDLPIVQSFPNSFHVKQDKLTKAFYVGGFIERSGKRKHIVLHRLILDAPQGKLVDHINHNTLDNRRSNLRLVTQSENQQNRKGPASHNSCGIRGVSWHSTSKKWMAYMKINGKRKYIGFYSDIKDAEKAIIQARKKYMPFSKEGVS